MKITKKLLGIVLSIAMVASTLVLPITAEAADVNFIHKVTFDEAADATGVFGTGDAYQVVAGDAESDSRFPALNANDKIAKLTAGSVGTPADGTAGSYLFGKNWGDNTGVAHATLQFDIALTNSYNEFRVYPAGNGDDGGIKRYGIELPGNVGDQRTLKTLKNSWDRIDTGAVITRFQWYEIAIEWDTAAGEAYVYVDGTKVDTMTGVTGSVTPNDFLFQMTSPDNGSAYINNLYYYEGGYQTIEDPFYPAVELDMEDSDDITRLGSVASQVDGLAGKVSTDKVAYITGATTRDYADTQCSSGIVTYETSLYVPAGQNAQFHVFNTNANNFRYAMQLRADGTVVCATANLVSGVTSIWTELNDTSLTHGTFNQNTWNKVAIEYNSNNNTVKFYVNGEVVRTVTTTAITGTRTSFPRDFGITNSGSFYMDNLRVYDGAYMADEAITVTGATGNTVPKAASIDAIKAYAAGNDRAVVYADATLTTEATTVSDANYLLVQNDELYAVYQIVSPYGTKYVWNTFSTSSDLDGVSGVALVNGMMGKDSSDMVGNVTAHTGWKGGTYSDEILTAEVQAYAGSNKVEMYSGTQIDSKDRPGVYIQNGKLGYVKANGWVYTDICDVDMNMWHKMAIEMNRTTGMTKIYLDGELVKSGTDMFAYGSSHTQDWRIQGTGYIDNWHIYGAAYVADSAITVASTDVVTVSGTTLTATEGTTLDQLAATVTAGTAKFYTDTTLATETSDVNAATVMLVNNGEIYKKYTVNITSPYGEKYRWYDFTSSNDITNGTIVNGLAGKAASDKVLNISGSGADYNWGSWYASKVVTIEAQVLSGANKIEIYTGSNHAGEDRPGFYVRNGKVGYVNANGWAYTDAADIDTTIWNKVALTMDANNGNAKLYLNGELIGTYDVAYNSNGINQDFRVQDNGYIDNFHVYGAAYVADETIATPSAVADGTFVVANGQTLAEAAATVTDGTATFYTDTTYATEATLSNVGYVLINKGELYKAYPVKVASKYDGALLSTNFNAGSIDYAGNFAGNGAGSWYNTNAGVVASTSYSQPGGKDSMAFTVTAAAYGEGTRTNARLQTGWGNNANTNYSSGTYTIEAQLWKDQAVSGGGIGIKMRNADLSDNTIITLDAPAVANEWIKLALTVDTEAGTWTKYVNGVETDSGELGDYTVVTDQANLNACDNADVTVTTALDNFRIYAGAYKGDEMPVIDDAVTMDAGATVADVIAETGADFVVTATGAVADNSALAETGMKAVKVNGECYAYCDVTATALITDVTFDALATGTAYEKDGVKYVFVAVTTDTINDISLYDTFRVTDGTVVKEMALSELMGTTLTGAAEIGVLVKNVPAANKDNFQAKLVLAD